MKKVIYPLSYDCRELINHYGIIDRFTNIELVVKDNAKNYYEKLSQMSSLKSVNVSDMFSESLKDADEVVFVGGAEISDYLEKIKIANEEGKKIYAVSSVMELLSEKNENKYVKSIEEDIKIQYEEEDDEILEIDVPVIAVMGVGPYCDKFSCELYLRKYYEELGYKVLQFGSKEIAPLFGFNSMPKFALNSEVSITKRITALNHFIVEQIEKERPDIIIIGSVDGIIPLNMNIHNNFSESAMIISSAMAIDYMVVGVYFDEDLQEDFINYLGKCVEYKYNSELLAICISNTAYEPTAESFGKKVKFYHLDTENICGQVPNEKNEIVFCNIHNLQTMQAMANKSLDLLQNNVDMIM